MVLMVIRERMENLALLSLLVKMATGSSTMLTLANHLEEHQVLPELALLPFTMFQEHQAMKKGFG